MREHGAHRDHLTNMIRMSEGLVVNAMRLEGFTFPEIAEELEMDLLDVQLRLQEFQTVQKAVDEDEAAQQVHQWAQPSPALTYLTDAPPQPPIRVEPPITNSTSAGIAARLINVRW